MVRKLGIHCTSSLTISIDPHGHDAGAAHTAHGPEIGAESKDRDSELEKGVAHPGGAAVLDSAIAQILGIAILEFGIVFHSVLIGMTLAVDEQFKILFIVLVFHRESPRFALGLLLSAYGSACFQRCSKVLDSDPDLPS